MPKRKRQSHEDTKGRKGTPDLLFTLPPEIRNQIYEYYLAKYGTRCDQGSEVAPPYDAYRQPRLFQASRRVKAEALPMYYANNSFIIYISGTKGHEISEFAAWLRRTVLKCGGTPMRSLVLKVTGSALVFLEKMLPLVDLQMEFRRINIAVLSMLDGWPNQKHRWQDVQRLGQGFTAIIDAESADDYDEDVRNAVIEGIEVGIHAGLNGWSREKMKDEFERVLDQRLERGRFYVAVRRPPRPAPRTRGLVNS